MRKALMRGALLLALALSCAACSGSSPGYDNGGRGSFFPVTGGGG